MVVSRNDVAMSQRDFRRGGSHTANAKRCLETLGMRTALESTRPCPSVAVPHRLHSWCWAGGLPTGRCAEIPLHASPCRVVRKITLGYHRADFYGETFVSLAAATRCSADVLKDRAKALGPLAS